MSDCPQCAQIRADAATVVHALDCAISAFELSFHFAPVGTPLDPRVTAAKERLDRAMAALRRPAMVPAAEEVDEAVKILMARQTRLIACLQSAQALIDTLMTELRHAGLALGPSLQLTAAHLGWQKRMEELLEDK